MKSQSISKADGYGYTIISISKAHSFPARMTFGTIWILKIRVRKTVFILSYLKTNI